MVGCDSGETMSHVIDTQYTGQMMNFRKGGLACLRFWQLSMITTWYLCGSHQNLQFVPVLYFHYLTVVGCMAQVTNDHLNLGVSSYEMITIDEIVVMSWLQNGDD